MVPVEDRVVVDEDFSLFDLLLLSSFSKASSYFCNDPPAAQPIQTSNLIQILPAYSKRSYLI